MDALYWISYVAAPIVGGVVALAGLLSRRPQEARERSLAPARAALGIVLLVSAIHGTTDLAQIAGGLNWKGRVLFVAIVLALLGLGSLAALAIAGGLAMVLVRARVWLQIFS